MRLGYLKQFISLFGVKYGTSLYLKLSFNRTNNIRLPGIKHPISLRKGTTDLKVFFQIFVNKEYNTTFPTQTKIILDGGANIGLFSIYMANKFPNSKIVAIEPESGNYKQLQKNTSYYSNITCIKSGIWNKDTKLSFVKEDASEWGYETIEDKNGSIEAIGVETIMKRGDFKNIDVLKLDIESSEKEVFQEEYDHWLSKCTMLIVELHDTKRSGCSRAFFEAINSTFKTYQFDIIGENVIIRNQTK